MARSEFVTLVSSDGFKFVISREAAQVSGTLSSMLNSDNFVESRSNVVNLTNISGILLEKVCEYMCYNVKYEGVTDMPDFDISPELALELLVVADYLNSE